MTLHAKAFDSPVGVLVATVGQDSRVTQLLFAKDRNPKDLLGESREPVLWDTEQCNEVQQQVTEYFEGKRKKFDLDLNATGTPFQKSVWKALQTIPFGETRSYGELASALGRPGASRAIGRANGTNPISIIVPCHRVIGADGSLTGFGGGMEAKRRLLSHEGATFADDSAPRLPGLQAMAI